VILSHFKYSLAAVYLLYGVCVQTSVSVYMIRRDLIQTECVKYIMLGSVMYYTIVVYSYELCWNVYPRSHILLSR